MRNRNRGFVIFGILVIAFVLSIGLNLFLFQQGKMYYEQLNALRLDPLGLSGNREVHPIQLFDPLKRVVFFGDSRAAMWMAPENIHGYEFINLGIGSQTSAQVLARYDVQVRPLKPDILVIQVGINDLKTIPLFPEKRAWIVLNCKTNLQKILEKALEQNAIVIITTIIPEGRISAERIPFWSGDVSTAVKEVNQSIFAMQSERVFVMDTVKLVTDERGIVKDAYRFDFLHLNEAGYQVLNEELVRWLVQIEK